jgi:cell division septum initiation protein DivIVA
VDVHAKLAELRRTVAEARSMPMSASVLVNRAELLGRLDEISAALHSALADSRRVVSERESVVEEGRSEAGRILAGARQERERIIAGTDVHRAAQREAERLLEKARADAEALRVEADDYVDAKLANVEITLERTTEAVRRGRERLAGRSDLSGITTAQQADDNHLSEHLDG